MESLVRLVIAIFLVLFFVYGTVIGLVAYGLGVTGWKLVITTLGGSIVTVLGTFRFLRFRHLKQSSHQNSHGEM